MTLVASKSNDLLQDQIIYTLKSALEGLDPNLCTERDVELALRGTSQKIVESGLTDGNDSEIDAVASSICTYLAGFLRENTRIAEYLELTAYHTLTMYMKLGVGQRLPKIKLSEYASDRKETKTTKKAICFTKDLLKSKDCNNSQGTQKGIRAVYYCREDVVPARSTITEIADVANVTISSQQIKEKATGIADLVKKEISSIESWSDVLKLIAYCVNIINTFSNLSSDDKFAIVDMAVTSLLLMIPGPFNGIALIIYKIVGRIVIRSIADFSSKFFKQISSSGCCCF